MALLKRGVKSTNPRKPYTVSHRVSTLSANQIIAAERIAQDLVSSLQVMVDDRIEEDTLLRILITQSGVYEEELELVKEIILKTLKREFKKMSNL